jgi:hypothetical protein
MADCSRMACCNACACTDQGGGIRFWDVGVDRDNPGPKTLAQGTAKEHGHAHMNNTSTQSSETTATHSCRDDADDNDDDDGSISSSSME